MFLRFIFKLFYICILYLYPIFVSYICILYLYPITYSLKIRPFYICYIETNFSNYFTGIFMIKGTVSLISSDPQCKDIYALIKFESDINFFSLKMFIFIHNFSAKVSCAFYVYVKKSCRNKYFFITYRFGHCHLCMEGHFKERLQSL